MSIVGKVASGFRKLGQLFRSARQRRKDAATQDELTADPWSARIALLGHTGAGKTVFYATLFDSFRNAPDFQLVATSGATDDRLQRIIDGLRGQEYSIDGETRSVPPSFPLGTTVQDVERLHLSVTRPNGRSFPLEALEYPGEYLAITVLDKLPEEILAFFCRADVVLFMLDPTMLDNAGDLERRISSLQVLLERIATERRRTRADVPIALVISKADTLPGFHTENQVALIPDSLPVTRRTTYEKLQQDVIEAVSAFGDELWAKSVKRILVSSGRLLRTALRHADGLQIFCVSSVGAPDERPDPHNPESTTPVPPTPLKPVGIQSLFRWWVDNHLRRRVERRARVFALVTFWISVAFVGFALAWHLPHHFAFKAMAESIETDPIQNACPASEDYLEGFWTKAFHRSMRRNVAQIMPYDIETESCSCDTFASALLREVGCESARLERCEDVRSRCFEPFESGLPFNGDRSANAPLAAVSKEDWERCREELERRRSVEIRGSRAATAAEGEVASLVDAALSLDSKDTRFDPVRRIRDRAVAIRACAPGELLESSERALIDTLAAQFGVSRGAETVDALASRNWEPLVEASHAFRRTIGQQRDGDCRDALRRVVDWVENQSCHCVKTLDCADLESETCANAVREYGENHPDSQADCVQELIDAQSGLDPDGDGLGSGDNCKFVANPDQRDRDADGKGDLCDNCPSVPNRNQRNRDGDDFGDACDRCPATPNTDSDGDGFADECPVIPTPPQPPPEPEAVRWIKVTMKTGIESAMANPPSRIYCRTSEAKPWFHNALVSPDDVCCVPRESDLQIGPGPQPPQGQDVRPLDQRTFSWDELIDMVGEQAIDFLDGDVSVTIELTATSDDCP